MKRHLKQGLALLMIVLMIAVSVIPAFAAGQPSSYSSSRNSGERDVICTTLVGTGAGDYYTGQYTYDELSELSQSALLQSLRTLMTSTHKKQSSYDDCRNMADETDCENGNTSIITIYTSYASSQSEYSGGNGWNREHVWPKSLGGFETSGAGADLHHIRPSENRTNSNRGNLKYGEVSGGKSSTGNLSGIVGGTYGSYFEPLDNVKGDVARICLYVYVRWGGQYSKCSSITNVFQSVDVLLEWCEMDPVDTWEMGRNEVVEAYQGNRNVFIDYPELAWMIFGREVPEDMVTPSGKAQDGSAGGDPTCTHASTELRDAAEATCGEDGYTGDVYCKSCGARITKGTAVKATGNHTFGEWTVNETAQTKSRTCETCKKVETQSIAPGSCTHTDTVVRDAVVADCGNMGYSGDTYCADCDTLLSRGSVSMPDPNNHAFGEWGPSGTLGKEVRQCQICKAVEERDVSAAECTHQHTELRDEVIANCGNMGYSGDAYCAVCGILVTRGSITLPNPDNHVFGDWMSGDTAEEEKRVCEICGAKDSRPVTEETGSSSNSTDVITSDVGTDGTATGDANSTAGGCELTVVGSSAFLLLISFAAVAVLKKKD